MSDLPRDQAIKQAQELVAQGWMVFFKYTCPSCMTRLTLRDPNTLWEYGECDVCGRKTKLDQVGFMLVKGI